MKSKLTAFSVLALAIHSTHAAERIWADSAGNTNWTSSLSWVDGFIPSNSAVTDTATFTSVANAQPYLNVGATIRSVAGIDFRLTDGGLNFTSDEGATLRLGAPGIDATTQVSGESTVSVTNIKVEGGGHQWTLFSNTSNASTSTFSVSSNIELATALTVRSDRANAANNVGIINLSGNISESGGVRALTLNSTSAVRNTINLTGSNSYTGTTTIQQVTVTANSLANAGTNSALGNSGIIILGSNASVANLTFQNLATDGSTDRLLSMKGTLGTQPYTLSNDDADNAIAFTNPGNTGDVSVSTANNLIFALGGTNTGNNIFGQVINDRSGGGITILRKEDAGTWALTNSANTYTGSTTVNAGLLRIDSTGALGGGNLDLSGGVLGLAAGDMTNRTVGTGTGEVRWSSSGGFAAFGAERIVHFGTPGSTISWTATSFIGAGNTLVLGHSTSDATLNWQQALSFAGSERTIQVNDGAAAVDARISANLGGGGSSGFNKTGAGTLELTSANNTYPGATRVTAGALRLGGSNQLPDTTNVILAAGTLEVGDGFTDTAGVLTCTGNAAINLGLGATLVFADSNLADWTGGTLNITGDFTNTSIKFATSGGLSSEQLALISVNGGGQGTYTLDESGYLVAGAGGTPYETWATGNEPFDGDANGDGVQDGLAFLLGAATPATNAIDLLPTVTPSGGGLVLSFSMRDSASRGTASLSVEHSKDLGIADPWTTVLVTDADSGPTDGVTFAVTGSGLLSVTATIDASAAEGAGNLFGRLKALKP